MSPDPTTGRGFDAPAPAEAYANAPEALVEAAQLTRLQIELTTQGSTLPTEPVTYGTREWWRLRPEREYRLRVAALTDRLALDTGAEADVAEAASRAHELLQLDRLLGGGLGPIGPNSPEWDPSARPYVRQEYPAWLGPVPNFDHRTEVPNLPEPCDAYDYVGDNEWCRRCGWYLADHPGEAYEGFTDDTAPFTADDAFDHDRHHPEGI
ncbi:hypothetical protein ACIRD3_39715 [Kitasatospora sp. NPDC093550]|uniref:hypothetical protein n=1 Tax=Kitasatospora sp. NPDC093550 TaxID=3364089 RepID=UPI0038295FDE